MIVSLWGTYDCCAYCPKFMCVVVSFVVMLIGCLVLEFGTIVSLNICAVTLDVGSSAFIAWSWFLHGFDLSDL